MPDRSDLPQGTLDLLILQVVAAGALHVAKAVLWVLRQGGEKPHPPRPSEPGLAADQPGYPRARSGLVVEPLVVVPTSVPVSTLNSAA